MLKQGAVGISFSLLMSTSLGFSKEEAVDCGKTYEQAHTLLNTTYEKALKKQHPDMKQFSTDFRQSVKRLKSGSCDPEIFKLTEYIRLERQKYPLAAPIED